VIHTGRSAEPLRRFGDLTAEPWRNGGGVTREVFRVPSVEHGPDFAARVSIADVDADGEFSRFDGVDRIIMLLRGPVMRLFVDGQRTDLAPAVPFAFPGDARTRCEIDSPTRDLNIMTRRGEAAATLTVLGRGEVRRVGGGGGRVVVVGLDGGAAVTQDVSDGETVEPRAWPVTRLAELDSFVWSGAGAITVSGDAAIIVISVRPVC
jgi:environmental stress-induced protein Ves